MKDEKKPKKAEQKTKTEETAYKGSQLLRMDKYNHRIARIVIDAEKLYTFAEADTLIENYGK